MSHTPGGLAAFRSAAHSWGSSECIALQNERSLLIGFSVTRHPTNKGSCDMKLLYLALACVAMGAVVSAQALSRGPTVREIALISDEEGAFIRGGDPCGGIAQTGYIACGTGCRDGELTGVCPDLPTKYVTGSGESKVVGGLAQTCSVCNVTCATLNVNIVGGCNE